MTPAPTPQAARSVLIALLSVGMAGCIFGGKDKDEDTGTGDWLVGSVDLGADKASGEGFVIGNGDDLWFAAEQFVPELRHTYPASSIPLYVWEEIFLVSTLFF